MKKKTKQTKVDGLKIFLWINITISLTIWSHNKKRVFTKQVLLYCITGEHALIYTCKKVSMSDQMFINDPKAHKLAKINVDV